MALFKILSRNYRRYDRFRKYDWAPTHALTLATWFYGNHASIDQHMVGMPVLGYRLFLRSLGGYSHLSADLGINTITDPEPIVKSTWTHAAMVWTGERLKLFKNGEVVFSEDINDIRYMKELYGTSIWAFENTIGGNSHQLGLNLFTMWGSALTNVEVEYLAEAGNPANVQYEGIRIGDYLDEPDRSGVFGDFLPTEVINEGIIDLPPSPFPGGIVPYPVPEIYISSSSSSESSASSLSSESSSPTSESSPSSLSSLSGTLSESSNSSSSSSGEGVVFGPGIHTWTVPNNVETIDVRAWGGGGGGGGAFNHQAYVFFVTASGGGGGGGAYIEEDDIPVTPGETLNIIVGAGGAAGKSQIVDILQRCGSSPTDGGDGGSTYIRRGLTDLVGVEGGTGGGHGYVNNAIDFYPRPGEGGTGGSPITPAGGSSGQDGSRGIPTIRAYFWPPDKPGGNGGVSGDPGWGDGGDGSATDSKCAGGVNVGQRGNGGRVEIDFVVLESSSSSTRSSLSSPDESESSTSSSTGSSETTESSLSSAG